MLHKKWVENVVWPLQQRIIEKVISYRKPGQSQVKYEYCLKHTNKPVGTGFYCFFYTTMMPFFLLSSCRFLLWPAKSGPSHHSLVCLLALTASGVREGGAGTLWTTPFIRKQSLQHSQGRPFSFQSYQDWVKWQVLVQNRAGRESSNPCSRKWVREKRTALTSGTDCSYLRCLDRTAFSVLF